MPEAEAPHDLGAEKQRQLAELRKRAAS